MYGRVRYANTLLQGGKEGAVPRLDGVCYDNTNVQVEKKLQMPLGPGLRDHLVYVTKY